MRSIIRLTGQWRALAVALATWWFCAAAMADLLELRNGDQIHGTLRQLTADSVLWNSELLGELTIPKAQVVRFTNSQALKVNGYEQPCTWVDMTGDVAQLRCAEDAPLEAVNWRQLAHAEPYAQYQQVGYQVDGTLSVSGTRYRGNTEKEDWQVDAESRWRKGDLRHSVRAEYDGISEDGGPVDERYDLNYSFNRFWTERWYYYAAAGYLRDEAKDIDQRLTGGLGLGTQLWHTDDGALEIESGFNLVDEQAITSDPNSEISPQRVDWRWNLDWHWLVWKDVRLFHRHTLTMATDNTEDSELRTSSGLRVPLVNKLYTEFNYEWDYDNLPPEGTQKKDTRFTLGLGYQW